MPVLLYVYDTQGEERTNQDIGYDGLSDGEEATVKGTGPDTGDPEKIATGAGSVGPVPPPLSSPPPPPPPQLINKIKNNDRSFLLRKLKNQHLIHKTISISQFFLKLLHFFQIM